MRKTLFVALMLCVTAAFAQEPKKPLSPAAKTEGKIGGKNVTIDYSAPSMRGRVIMGELVPYGQVWRTGANAATKLTTATDLKIGGLHVPAGTYSLFTIPGEKEWTLIVNKQSGMSGTEYDETQDLGRVKMKVAKMKNACETFNIGLKKNLLTLTWENTTASVPVTAY